MRMNSKRRTVCISIQHIRRSWSPFESIVVSIVSHPSNRLPFPATLASNPSLLQPQSVELSVVCSEILHTYPSS